MPTSMVVHYKNTRGFTSPHLYVWYAGSTQSDTFGPSSSDTFGQRYDVELKRDEFGFKFKDGPGQAGPWEPAELDRSFRPVQNSAAAANLAEIWCTGEKAFVYPVQPRDPEPVSAETFLRTLAFKPGTYIPGSGGFSGLGAHLLADRRTVFGFYHPNAARVFVAGTFNAWQRPSHPTPDPARFIELKRYRGYFGYPNIWLAVTQLGAADDEYKFFVIGGVPSDDQNRLQQHFTDPYARRLGPDFGFNNSVIVDPTTFAWNSAWQTPDIGNLILYELSVYGFSEGDPDVTPAKRGTFRGVTERIDNNYFGDLGVTALSLMPLVEVPSQQGPQSLGYDPSVFPAVERDFGAPDDLRALVDAAHAKGLAVILDQVFNHTSNSFNPLWQMVLEHPLEQFAKGEGGLYFNGTTEWGNRIATEKSDVQNLLIDTCKMWLVEYRVDGFRFDATHTQFMDHAFLLRLADELKGVKPAVILIAENLPNQPDLNLEGWNGFAQWNDAFHDRLKAFLREGPFDGRDPDLTSLGGVFFFSKPFFAAHTNNAVNYTESHDETSVPFEVGTNPVLNHPAAKDRKGRLGMLATMTALGQPMIYMGQEFNVERDRKFVSFTWPRPLSSSGFYEWTRRLIQLRARYPGLKLSGFNPAEDGRFEWIVGPWMGSSQGGGQAVIGWRARPNDRAFDTLVVLLNFEGHDVTVDVRFGLPGTWVKLADIDRVNDIAPGGTNSAADPTALRTNAGFFGGFTLPSSSGFIYKWEAP